MNNQQPVIFSYSFEEQGSILALEDNQIATELENSNLSWVHLDGNATSTKYWLEANVSYLDHLIIDALLAQETRSRIMEFEGGLLIILRGVNTNIDANPDDMVSLRIWVDQYRVITIQKREMNALFDFKNNLERGRKIKGSGEFLYNLIYQILSEISTEMLNLSQRLDKLEDLTLNNDKKNNGKKTLQGQLLKNELLELRSQFVTFKRYLSPQKEVIHKLKNCEYLWINDWAKRHFQENYDQITRMIEETDELKERSKILNDEIVNIINDKLNRHMYKISLITVIFMPLTFLTGLFGMNVGGIPASQSPFGFIIFTSLMIFIAILQVIFFKKRDWFR
ncbi:MAG: zinc transporter ZntB [Rickettsiales bacterium]|nr:zinc transporter ZntB [Rickettsiales bacterium]